MANYITNVTIDGTQANIKDAETSNNLTAHINANNPHHIQVGGRNLMTNSKDAVSVSYPASNESNSFMRFNIALPTGATQFVLSFDAKSTVAGDKIISHFFDPSNIIRGENSAGEFYTNKDGLVYTKLTTDWERYWVKWTAPVAETRSIIAMRLKAGDGSGTVSMRNVKFETGTVPTDWTPALEDLETSVTLDQVYPVGSIYMSVNSVDPSTLFGGTWSRIEENNLGDTGVNMWKRTA